jgi:hypothetical protein
MWAQGLCGIAGFPNADTDLLAKREEIMDNAEHITKYKIISKFELSVQHSPDSAPQCTMEIPQINVDLAVALARNERSDDPLKSVCIVAQRSGLPLIDGVLTACYICFVDTAAQDECAIDRGHSLHQGVLWSAHAVAVQEHCQACR